MLWVRYEAHETYDFSFLQEIATKLAALVPSFPVGLYDQGPFGVGLIFHNGVINYDENPEPPRETSPDTRSPPTHESLPISLDTVGMVTERHLNLPSVEPGNPVHEMETPQGDGEPRGNSDAREGEKQADDSRKQPAEPTRALSPAFRWSRSASERQRRWWSQGVRRRRGERENKDDSGSTNDKPEVNQKQFSGEFSAFTGTATVDLPSNMMQELSITFSLQIVPNQTSNDPSCRINLDNVIVGASKMQDKDNKETDLNQLYEISQVWIRIGQSGGKCAPPRGMPRYRDNFLKITDTTTLGANLSGSISPLNPGLKPGVSVGKSRSGDRPTTVVEYEGKKCGIGRPGSWEWEYLPKCASTRSQIEFARDCGDPVHTVSFTVHDDGAPNEIEVRVKACFERPATIKTALRGHAAAFSQFQLTQEIQLRHIKLALEAKVGTKEDWCLFPVHKQKKGTFLKMDINATSGTFTHPETTGVVSSSFQNAGAE
jgi:hypothetical protein